MTRFIKSSILFAAVAAVPLFGFTPDARAQYRLPYDGRATDANNRVGSGGNNPNDSEKRAPAVPNGNDLVTGNVTGGKHFRGNVPYRNANEFRGNTSGGTIDNFIRSSASSDPNDPGSSYRVQPFYGSSRTVTPPPNFQPGPLGIGGYTPPPPVGTVVNRPIGDQRVGAVDLVQPVSALPSAGELMLPGQIDPTGAQQYITASPLSGIRQLGAADLGESVTNIQYNPVTGRLTPDKINKMREELNAAGATELTPAPVAPDGTTPAPTGAGLQPVAPKAIEQEGAVPGAAVGQQGLNTAIAQTGAAGMTDQSVRQRLLAAPPQLVPAKAQSGIYAEMLKRHQEAAADRNISDVEASQAYNAAVRARNENEAAATGQPGQPGAAPGAPTPQGGVPAVAPPADGKAPQAAPGVTDYAKLNQDLLKKGIRPESTLEKKPVKKAQPVKVQSLASGMKAKGLADILTNAESLMKQGKFTSALDQYDQAEQVSPNLPLTRLGRANAELGASYYARAEAHLREAFTANPELLVAQYDLTALLGEQRLGVLVKDLKDISNRDQHEARPVFLLAYIAYNTGHEQNAEAYLDLADKRSGGKDKFYQLLRDNWALPEKGAAPADMNK
jgi:tetratricopeptide (TPR) repeat protein